MIAKQNKLYLLASLCNLFAKEINILSEDLYETVACFHKAIDNYGVIKIAEVLGQ